MFDVASSCSLGEAKLELKRFFFGDGFLIVEPPISPPFAKLITLISFVTYYSLLCFMIAGRALLVNCAVDAFTLKLADRVCILGCLPWLAGMEKAWIILLLLVAFILAIPRRLESEA